MTINIPQVVADELGLPLWQVSNALQLLAEGNTVPFIARYRKEKTGALNEIQLRQIEERNQYLTELEERKEAILKSIEDQGKLTDELRAAIEATTQKTELEDLYLPYRPKRRTRATVAREKGLEPLAEWIKSLNVPESPLADLASEAVKYVDSEKGVSNVEEALSGASDILAEEVAENAEYRAHIRNFLFETGVFATKIKEEHAVGTTQYEMYRDYRAPVKSIAAHNMLAIRRGEEEGFLIFTLEFAEQVPSSYLAGQVIQTKDDQLVAFLHAMLEDSFNRLMKNTLVGEVRLQKKEEADEQSIHTFAANLRELLLTSPAGMRQTLGIDPGFRTGCKVAVIDRTGRFLEYHTIFPHASNRQHDEAARVLTELIEKHEVELVAVGNGTAGRETLQFTHETLAKLEKPPIVVMVSESGASVYSASEVAIQEFPQLDLTVRGAISIGRRLQDPLAELVKIDPKSIGVGQYQHDVDQGLLKKKLEETVESCVNYVGVDLNTASAELLKYVAGITPSLAKNIVEFRNDRGAFRNRAQLMEVPRFGPKAFEQAAGFLRIRNGDNPLDNTAVHPESYPVVESIARDLGVALEQITRVPDRLKKVNLKKYVSETAGELTLKDILSELEKPGRDPREQFTYATFRDDVTKITDLKEGMVLEGVVTNVANFGAFVDIGVHRDGLVHVSQLGNRYVKDATEVVKVGQVVKVRVIEVNEKLNRISLSMRTEEKPRHEHRPKQDQKGRHENRGDQKHRRDEPHRQQGKPQQENRPKGKPQRKDDGPHYTLEDLVRKFNTR